MTSLGGEDFDVSKIPVSVRHGAQLQAFGIVANLAKKQRLTLEASEVLLYSYCNTPTSNLLISDETEHCILLTNQRLIKIEYGKVDEVLVVESLQSVEHQKNSRFRYDKIVAQRQDGQTQTVGIVTSEVTAFFVSVLRRAVQALADRPVRSGSDAAAPSSIRSPVPLPVASLRPLGSMGSVSESKTAAQAMDLDLPSRFDAQSQAGSAHVLRYPQLRLSDLGLVGQGAHSVSASGPRTELADPTPLSPLSAGSYSFEAAEHALAAVVQRRERRAVDLAAKLDRQRQRDEWWRCESADSKSLALSLARTPSHEHGFGAVEATDLSWEHRALLLSGTVPFRMDEAADDPLQLGHVRGAAGDEDEMPAAPGGVALSAGGGSGSSGSAGGRKRKRLSVEASAQQHQQRQHDQQQQQQQLSAFEREFAPQPVVLTTPSGPFVGEFVLPRYVPQLSAAGAGVR